MLHVLLPPAAAAAAAAAVLHSLLVTSSRSCRASSVYCFNRHVKAAGHNKTQQQERTGQRNESSLSASTFADC
jgi:hypothetical protein